MASRRYRNFVTVVYPDSAPDGWVTIASEFKTPVLISPLHDKDLNATGEPKKAHYHVMIMFEGMKSPDQVKVLFDQIGGVGLENVNSLRGYARYLCHLDNPEKAQYSPCDVLAFSGADYVEIIGLPSDRYDSIGAMIDFCTAERETCYSRFVRYCMRHNEAWFRILCDSGTLVIREYLKGLEWELKNSPGGEVLELG